MFAYVSCVGDIARFERNSASWGQLVRFRTEQTSLAIAYNSLLDELAPLDLEGAAFLHDDLEITDPHFEDKVTRAFVEPDVALVGIAGGGSAGGTTLGWWDHNPIGHQFTDIPHLPLIDHGKREGYVETLEGSVLVFSPWALENLRFDETPGGFYGVDEVCTQARAAGKRCVVADIDTHHHTEAGWDTPEQYEDWLRTDHWYRSKWESV